MGSLKLNTAVDLNQLEEDATKAQATVLNLLDRELQIKEQIAELIGLDDEARINGTADLILECEGLIEIQKGLKEQISRLQDRIDVVAAELTEDLRKEVEKKGDEKGKLETSDFKLRNARNNGSVEIEDEKAVLKKYRREPKPIPSWRKWPIDKSAAKKDLAADKEVKGCKLVYSYRLEIKRK